MHVRIPFLIDITIVDDPATAFALLDDPRVDRTFQSSGPLINRLIQGRLLKLMRIGETPLAAFLPRDDHRRRQAQGQQEAMFDTIAGGGTWLERDLAPLIAYVRGHGGLEDLGIACQQLLGRLFVDGYGANADTYAAARLLDAHPGGNPFRALWNRLSGRVEDARTLLWDAAGRHPEAVHATTIAVHNLVFALIRMRGHFADPGRLCRVSDETIVAQCVSAPPRLLRRVAGRIEAPGLERPLRPNALLVISLGRLHKKTGRVGDAFMAGRWSQCPARGFVPLLLRTVWRGAAEQQAADRQAADRRAANQPAKDRELAA